MSRLFFYAHGGSGNHGCEAIVRATAQIFQGEELHLISSKPEEDAHYGLGEFCNILKDRTGSVNRMSISFWKAYAALKINKDYVPMDKLWYEEAFSHIRKGDTALSIGGDNYCYADVNKYIMLHDILKKRGAKTVLWGCSVELELVENPNIAADLARYDMITARESISYHALKKVNSNTYLAADPAFVLEPQACALPEGFVPGQTIGINLSPMVMGLGPKPGIVLENFIRLVRYILDNTDCNVVLIPHVVWQNNDDRTALKQLYQAVNCPERVVLIEDHDCMQLKGLIARCRMFIGARTHATIAAYSSCVPTLVVGYSVKSRGIAKDLFGTENGYVLPVQQMTEPNQLTKAFSKIWECQDEIRQHLENMMPEYIERARSIKKMVERALEDE